MNHVVWSPECVLKVGNQVGIANDIAVFPTSNKYVLRLNNFAVE